MLQQIPQIKEASSMLILSNDMDSFQRLSDILAHYFPKTSSGHLHLATKYYTAKIKLAHSLWPSLSQLNPQGLPIEQLLETQSPSQLKHDLLIMLVTDGQNFDAQLYDLIIHRYNPDNFILIVDTKSKEDKWAGEDVISGEVNNFIEIIKEDLQALRNNLPERTQKGLLNDSYEDGSIFNLLELMETTQWTHIQRVEQAQVKEKYSLQNEQHFKADNSNGKQQAAELQEKKEVKEPEMIQQISEQQLEQQMNNFQTLMKQMMNFKTVQKSQPISNEQRKKAAEDMIQKLLGGSFL